MLNSKFIPSVRRINGIQIYFKTKTIVQVSCGSVVFNVVRWDKPGGGVYAKAWRPFCSKLCHRNDIESIYQIMRLARQYDLTIVHARHPEQPPPGIWERPSKYIWP